VIIVASDLCRTDKHCAG